MVLRKSQWDDQPFSGSPAISRIGRRRHALMLQHDSRRAARLDEAGDLILLEDQDRRFGLASMNILMYTK
jgi:uncharacterized protein DUF6596